MDGLGQEGDGAEPRLVEVQGAEPVGRQRGDARARLGIVPELGENVHVRAPADRIGARVLLRRRTQVLLDLGQAPLEPTQDDELEQVADDGIPAHRFMPDAQRLVDPRLGVAERALEQRLHRPALGEEPVLRRLAEPRGERRHRVDIGCRAGDIAELQPPCRAVLVGLDRPLELRGARGDLDQLAGELHLPGRVVGRMVRRDVAVEGVRERRGIAETPRRLQRLARDRAPARGVVRVAQGATAEPREQADAQLAVALADRLERSLEQRHEIGVVARDAPDEPPAVAERRAGELLAQAERLGKLRRLAVRLLRRRRVALARLAEGLERVAVVRGRILVGELGE